ncbi:MAG: polysaccharide biosynthesis tyrosine autokinase [Bacteroidetes bacterium]|nr:polysaccharide biosynthesis tyrosine autokinase [Bacteroidota bacterium]MBU1114486.1 polysaccharide biosynthesis tyrosine autokinase [Bacteroidota bacterium]MBU1799914.1 polysaccharide biosynthesis tyrosine autokinase [Bacteroidota bacterium]
MNNNLNNNGAGFEIEETNSLKDYVNLIKLNIIPILLITLTGLTVAIIFALMAKDIYTASNALKIQKPSGGGILDAPLLPEFSDFGNDRFIANEIEILKSYRLRTIVASSLIDSFKVINQPDSFYNLFDRSIDFDKAPLKLKSINDLVKMLEDTKIEQKRGLDIVTISYESHSPFEAKLIANSYADAYENLSLKYTRQQLTTVVEFLKEQGKEKYASLLVVEEKIKTFQIEGGIIALDEQAKALIDMLSTFEAQRDAALIEMIATNKQANAYKSEIDRQNPSISKYIASYATEPKLKGLQEQIAQLEMQRDLALSDTTISDASEVLLLNQTNRRINELKVELNRELETFKQSIFAASPEELRGLSVSLLEAKVKYESLKSSFEKTKEIVTVYESRFNELPEQTISLARLTRELNANEKLYQLVEEKYQESLIVEQSTAGNVLIIDPAIRPLLPSKPNRKLIVLIGLILGMGIGFGFAFIRNFLDNTVQTPEDIQKRNINVLGWIPKIEGITLNKEFEFIIAKKSDSIYSEAFRALRTKIQFAKIDKKNINTIHVTSSTPSEGKTTVSVNIAGSFAQTNRKTVILDCDLRKPRMHKVFGGERYPGFTDYFLGDIDLDSIIHKSELKNLDYITAGTIPPNPSEILGSNQMLSFIEKLKEMYDLVVIDSPPIIAVTDSEILSRIADASILVASAGETDMELMTKAVDLMRHENNSFIGVVLNKFSYRSGYGSYYKYYYYYSHNRENAKVKHKTTT